MTETSTELTPLDKAQALLEGASVMPGTEGKAVIVETEIAANVFDGIQRRDEEATTLRERVSELLTANRRHEERIVSALKEAISDGTIDLDAAKTLAESLSVDPDDLTPSYEVTVTVRVRVSGVKAEDEDEAGSKVQDAIDISLSGYGLDYDSFDQEDVDIEEVTEES